MKLIFKKILYIICIVSVILIFSIPVNAAGDPTGVLDVTYDTASPKHQALTMTVDSVASESPLQAFCMGWNFAFVSLDKSKSIYVYVPLAEVNYKGGYRRYTFPLTKGWTLDFTGIAGDRTSIRDLVSDKSKFDLIIKNGCTVTAEARIEKHSYSSSTGKYTELGVFSNHKNEVATKFSEFSSTFITNTQSDYYPDPIPLDPEPVLPTPAVNLTLPIDGTTVIQGTEVTFKGFGTGVHHIAGYVNGNYIGVQNNPNSDITVQMKYETTVKLDTIGDYTFQIKGRNTASDSENGTLLAVSAIHIVHVIAPPPNSGNVYIKCIDIDTNTEIPDTAQTIPGVIFGTAKTIEMPVLSGYTGQGSYQTFSTVFPDLSKRTADTSQTVTLTTANQKAYVYFWYKARPVQTSQPPVAVINIPVQEYAGNDVNFDGYLSHDPDGYITEYKWGLPGAVEQYTDNSDYGSTWYAAPGSYNVNLTVIDNDNNSGYNTRPVQIIEPYPQAKVLTTGKIKENRRITLDGSQSLTPKHYPIDWSKAAWKIEPVKTLTGAAMTWSDLASDDVGVRLTDGTVTTIGAITNQATLLKGQRQFDFQTRKAGVYKATLYVENTAGTKYNSTAEQLITVAKDLPPIADFTVELNGIRSEVSPGKGQNYIIKKYYCISSSPDGDQIQKRIWSFKYDADNDGDFDGKFTDREGIYGTKGSVLAVPEERLRTAVLAGSFDAAAWAMNFNPREDLTWMAMVVDGDNDMTAQRYSFEVGNYAAGLEVTEYIGPEESIMELIKPGDYKTAHCRAWE